MKKLDFSKNTIAFLSTLAPKQYKQICTAIFNLCKNTSPQDAKKLQGYDEIFRIDSGEFRIVYKFTDEIVYIIIVGKRNDDEVYKQLKRLF